MIDWKTLTRAQRIEIIRDGIARNRTSGELARELTGASKNALLGYAHRNGLKFPGISSEKAADGARERALARGCRPPLRKPKAPKPVVDRVVKIVPKPEAPAPRRVASEPNGAGVSIVDRRSSQCAWIRDDRLCCGEPVVGVAQRYCRHHFFRVYRREEEQPVDIQRKWRALRRAGAL